LKFNGRTHLEMNILFERFRAAIDNIDQEEIILCIERGVYLNQIYEHGCTAFTNLAFASKLGFSYTDLDTEEKERQMLVEDLKKIELMEFLLWHGAHINEYGEGGLTALVVAADQAKVEMVKFLLENGANPNVNFFDQTEPGSENVNSIILYTALQDAEVCCFEYARSRFQQIVDLLVKHGAILYK